MFLLYALRRLLLMIPVLWIAVTFCFFVMRLAPGGPFDEERALEPVTKAALEAHYNMDKPLVSQYFHYLNNLIHFDLGPSFTDRTYSVGEKIRQGLPFTLVLGGYALILSVVIGTITGAYSAFYQNTIPEYILAFFVLIGIVVPSFVLAPLFQEYIISPLNAYFDTRIFFISGTGGNDTMAEFATAWRNITIPVLVLSLAHIGRISRLMRASMIEVLGTNYIRTAKAKGIGERMTIIRHALRPAFIPVLSYLGPAASYLLTGSLVIETLFGLPGIGKFFIEAALSRDYGMVLGTVVIYMLLITVLNLIVDLLYGFLDPKVRLGD